ncbi:MAG: hypothetical protein ACKVT2_07970 [Saprospiraceae bacterium]
MFKSKKQSAIKAFEKQREKIGQLTEDNFVYWLIETCDIIKTYIGKDTVQENGLIALFKYSSVPPGVVTQMIKHRSKDIERLIETCISYVKEHGVSKDHSEVNKPLEFISVAITIGAIIFAAGWYFADLKTENKFRDQEKRIEQLQKQTDVLQDSMQILKTRNQTTDVDRAIKANSKN